jgi:hypothetical protein
MAFELPAPVPERKQARKLAARNASGNATNCPMPSEN